MEPLRSAIDPRSDSYRANYDAMSALVDRLRAELKRSTLGGGEKYVQRHLERGKLPPRERVEMLLDQSSYFLEIAPLAGIGMDERKPGFKHIIIRPIPGGGLNTASGSYESPYGTIKTHWEVIGNQFKLWVRIPGNTTATVYVPGTQAKADEGEHVHRGHTYPDSTEFNVPSGDYVFTSTL